jgi:phosphoribosylglycinamide formyltransferase-1
MPGEESRRKAAPAAARGRPSYAPRVPIRLAIFASHTGTTAQAVIDALRDRRIDGAAVLVICNNPDAEVLARAAAAGIPSVVINSRTHPDSDALDRAVLEAVRRVDATHILLAGYMKKLGPLTVRAFEGRVFNSHPALLPAFGGQGMYGDRVHEAVLAAGAARTGATVHRVTNDYDAGEILQQVDDVSSLGERVRGAERDLVVAVLAGIALGGGSPASTPEASVRAGPIPDAAGARLTFADHPSCTDGEGHLVKREREV